MQSLSLWWPWSDGWSCPPCRCRWSPRGRWRRGRCRRGAGRGSRSGSSAPRRTWPWPGCRATWGATSPSTCLARRSPEPIFDWEDHHRGFVNDVDDLKNLFILNNFLKVKAMQNWLQNFKSNSTPISPCSPQKILKSNKFLFLHGHLYFSPRYSRKKNLTSKIEMTIMRWH